MNSIFNFYTESFLITTFFIIVIFLLRLIFIKKSNRLTCVLWLCLLVRLLFPVSIDTGISFGEYKTPEITYSFITTDDIDDTYISDNNGEETIIINEKNEFKIDYMYIWYLGICIFVLYYAAHYFVIRKSCRKSYVLSDYNNVKIWDKTEACVIGIFKPVIYVPESLDSDEAEIIIKHETTHIKRHDNIFISLYFLSLALYWYNPLVWISYFMVLADVENACDEQALLNSDLEERKKYALTLLNFYKKGTSKDVFSLSFGKRNIRRRIENIGKQRKIKRIHIILITVICILLLAVSSLFYIAGRGSEMPEEIGSEQIGAIIPNIIYTDADKVIFYDYHGVFVYDLNKATVTDYVSFEKMGITSNIQGDNLVKAYASSDGSFIYITDYDDVYTYNCDKYKYDSEKYSESFMSGLELFSLNISNKIYDNAVSTVYSIDENNEIYWIYDGDTGIYSDLYIIMNKNGNINKYSVFE